MTGRKTKEPINRHGDEFQSLRSFIDALPQPILVADGNAHVYVCNKAAIEFTGKAGNEMLGFGWHSVVHPDDVSMVVSAWTVGVLGGGTVECEFRMHSSNGRYFWFRLSASSVSVEGHGPLWLGIGTNIDEIKRHEEVLEEKVHERTVELQRINQELAESKGLFEAFSDNSPVMYMIKDSLGRYCYLNRYARDWFGCGANYVDKTPFDLLSPEHAREILIHDDEVRRTGDTIDVIERAVSAGHGPAEFKCKKFPMKFGGETHVGVVAMDITELVAVERVLRDKEELLQLILDSLTDGVLVADCSGRFVLENKACYDMIGASDVSAPMEEWAEAFHCYHTDTDILLKPDELPLYRAINGMSSDDVEMVALNRGGGPNRYLNLVVSGRPLYDANDKLVGGLIVLRDVTSARATNLQLSSSNAELQSFAYVAAHDLQEPLRTVASYVDLLKRRYGGKLDERAASYIEGALAGARRMQNLVDDLLSLSRVETQAHPFEKVDTNAVVAAALENLQFAIDEAQAQVTTSSLPDVRGDTSQLRQLFQNLIGNAIKFRAGRVPEIAISALKKGYLWQFAVKDNGIGIAAEYHEKVFQVFQRLHGQSEYPGTGIGLAICRKIVERHGGRIWVESEPGQGTTFFFTLPELIES